MLSFITAIDQSESRTQACHVRISLFLLAINSKEIIGIETSLPGFSLFFLEFIRNIYFQNIYDTEFHVYTY